MYPNHLDPPLIDVAAGGYALPAQPAGYMSMWVVTSNGKVGHYSRLECLSKKWGVEGWGNEMEQ